MKIYLVGGAVRDRLLGLLPGDRDWVVIGATPQELGAAGFLPVGRDFPVFLHPQTHEEYALARVERKTAAGYHGFAFHTGPDVTLEEDLARRDLTINAMAQDESGQVIDPWGGREDLQNKVLRHVSSAFCEDPVRILRLARFLARYTEFTVAPDTQQLCCDMVAAGEVDALVPERVWQELSRGLMEAQPSRMVAFLAACGAWSRVVPALPVHAEMLCRIDTAAQRNVDLFVRFAVLTLPPSLGGASSCAAAGAAVRLGELSQALRVPVQCGELAELLSRERGAVEPTARGGAQALVAWFDRCDVWRRAERFEGFLQACACDGVAQADLDRLVQAWTAARAVVSAEVTAQALAQGLRGPAVGQALFNARVTSVRAVWGEAAA